ncbi:DCC1-like thiol-disulfide oxidoreductase family protein [uncultured Pontibacter sp.]|uniref:thiol-disulfide oxidoreductase DCC family protein n=1 Tax=uncultured Pontibacter sp. TaxID=453356 RepID=UPI002616205A|nr:DCC1-like thiol-disulfide oxidoreductase family protein [uncultured Pontibacter sp.]
MVAPISKEQTKLESCDVEPGVSNNQNDGQILGSAILKPILVYDGDCSFCKFWVSRWQKLTPHEVKFTPYQHLPEVYYGVKRQEFKKSVYLITHYRRLRGAAAVFEVLALGGNDFWNKLYYNIVLADVLFEAGYRFVASNRDFCFWVTKLFYKDARKFGKHSEGR